MHPISAKQIKFPVGFPLTLNRLRVTDARYQMIMNRMCIAEEMD